MALPALGGVPGGEGRISRAETVQLVAGLGLGSLIWMVNDFPDGQGALTKRSGRAVERALRGGFPGVPPERRGGRAAAAIARLVRSEAVGGTARTPCAFAERGAALTGPSRPAGVINAAWGHCSPISLRPCLSPVFAYGRAARPVFAPVFASGMPPAAVPTARPGTQPAVLYIRL